MELKNLIKSRAHRKLRHLSSYTSLYDRADVAPIYIQDISLENDEHLVGLYENLPGDRRDCVVVTTLGLHACLGEHWRFIRYDEMVCIESPDAEQKHCIERIVVHSRTEGVYEIPIRGGRDRLRDVWPFLGFLNRVLSDIERRL